MKCSIDAVTTDPKLYSNYTNQKKDYDGIKARMKQRLKWVNMYKKNGMCKRKLIACGVIDEKKIKIKQIGNIGNYYGDLFVTEHNGFYYWSIKDSRDFEWEEIQKSLYDELLVHANEVTDGKLKDLGEYFDYE